MTTPGGQGRFDGYDVLSQANHWDVVTQGVVLRRLGPPAPLRYFSDAEGATTRILLDLLLGQEPACDGLAPSVAGPQVDMLADIDSRLALEVTDGWHYAQLPHDGPAWRLTLEHLDADSSSRFGVGFAAASREQQMALIQGVQDLIGDSGSGQWHDLPARQVWSLWTRYACAAFYSHPWAWNEIGFGGPAYPRGYKNIGLDKREPWERPENDAHDPVSWGRRTEAARKAHLARFGEGTS